MTTTPEEITQLILQWRQGSTEGAGQVDALGALFWRAGRGRNHSSVGRCAVTVMPDWKLAKAWILRELTPAVKK